MTTETLQPPAHIAVTEAVAPSNAVAVASGRLLHDLLGLRAAKGEEIAQVEAMAMLNASLAFLRPVVGDAGIRRMQELGEEQGAGVAARDARSAGVGRKREVLA